MSNNLNLPVVQVQSTQAETHPPVPAELPTMAGYERVTRIGRGGMGEVYRAFDPQLQRWVALKRLRSDAISLGRLARFRTEAQALARLRHPNIVTVHELRDLEDGLPVLVMEYVEGGTLDAHLRHSPPLSPTESAHLVAILARAVQHAHDHGIVHRDLKPENILLDAPTERSDSVLGSCPRVTDFGLASMRDGPGQTLEGEIFGTPAYMAAEQAAGKTREVGPPADVWALGVILYRCLTGALPFQGQSDLDTLERVKAMEYPPLRQLCPTIPGPLEAVFESCLRRNPAERPTAGQLADSLQAFLTGLETPTRSRGAEPLATTQSYWRWLGPVGAVVFLAFCVVLGRFALFDADEQKEPQREEKTVGPARVVSPPSQHGLSVTLDVLNFQLFQKNETELGKIGEGVLKAQVNDGVVVRVELSQPGHFFLIAGNCNGKEQLLWPCDENTGRARDDLPPPALARLLYPPVLLDRADGQRRPHAFKLDDDPAGGWQAFLVVGSRRPLPAYHQWKQERGPFPWAKQARGDGVWRSDGKTLDTVRPGIGRQRGSLVPLRGQPPLLELCRWAAENETVTEAITFPVQR